MGPSPASATPARTTVSPCLWGCCPHSQGCWLITWLCVTSTLLPLQDRLVWISRETESQIPGTAVASYWPHVAGHTKCQSCLKSGGRVEAAVPQCLGAGPGPLSLPLGGGGMGCLQQMSYPGHSVASPSAPSTQCTYLVSIPNSQGFLWCCRPSSGPILAMQQRSRSWFGPTAWNAELGGMLYAP